MPTDRNPQLRHAWDFVEHTGRSIFLTGKAGTGKTTFLRTLVEKSTKQMVVVAPTGVAAINAGGMTIHSFFQLPLSPYVPGAQVKNKYDFSKEKRKIISSLDLLIIDEISMVRSDLLDAIDNVLRRFRRHSLPFGGVQLLMIGDLAQLTPVVTPEDEQLLRPYYDTPYFFGSKALQQVDYVTIQLEKIYRQADMQFVDLLNNIRENRATQQDFITLQSRYNPSFTPKTEEGYIRLTTHNRMADEYNDHEMSRLTTAPFVYDAEIEGTFPPTSYPTAQTLMLKVGAQVMFIKNDTDGLYYNGKIGIVTSLDNDKVCVRCTGEEREIEVAQQEWENAHYTINPETHEIQTEIQGVFRQYPLRLAWAITIHKSQGLTFERAIIDAGHSFAPGQVYVALSRCRSLDGIVIASPITPQAIISDSRVENYMERQEYEAQQSIALLPQLKENYYREMLVEMFTFTALKEKTDYMLRLLMEYFAGQNASLVQLFRQAAADFQTSVTDVSVKWSSTLLSMPFQQMGSEALLERVKRSATYFADSLSAVLKRPLDLVKGIQSNNKEALRRLDDAYSDLNIHFRSRMLLLKAMSELEFSLPVYLHERQRALVVAMGGQSKAEKEAKPKKTKKLKEPKEPKGPKEPKEPKEKTWETSFKLYKEGKSIDEIATERLLTPQTITSHLSRYVATGDIPIERLVPADHIAIIRRAISEIGTADGKGAIKAACPDEISYTEIEIVIRSET